MSRNDQPQPPLLRRALLMGGASVAGVAALGVHSAAASGGSASSGRSIDSGAWKEVETVVLTERWARDMARWDVMGEQFHPDSVVDISWIKTSGPEFVRLSRMSFEAGSRSCHVLSPVLIEVTGRRATADTGVVIAGQASLGGVPVFLTAYSRIVQRLEKRRGTWRISQLTCVYQFDYFTPAIPDQRLSLDPERLARYRASYSALSYWVEETRGAGAVRDDLPGVDRPASIEALYAANTAWLARG